MIAAGYSRWQMEIIISPEVNKALGTLEKVISVFREIGFNPRSLSLSRFVNNVFADLEENKSNDSKHFVKEFTIRNSQASRNSLSTHTSSTEKIGTSSYIETRRSSFSFCLNEYYGFHISTKQWHRWGAQERGWKWSDSEKDQETKILLPRFTSGQLTA
ncbi:hypothetical protein Tco_1115757 [Tanacetum coccineum]